LLKYNKNKSDFYLKKYNKYVNKVKYNEN
jgi:hypothetical protein